MTELDDIDEKNRQLLIRLVDQRFSGSCEALAVALNQKNGGFVREMYSGKKRITDKTIRKIEAIRPAFKAWFSQDAESEKQVGKPLNKPETRLISDKPRVTGIPEDRQLSATNHQIVPEITWDQMGVELSEQYEGVTFDVLALPRQLGGGARRLAFPDDSLAPDIKRGDIVVVEYGAAPLPNDVVFCRAKQLGIEFPGVYIQRISGGAYIALNQPGFDRQVDAQDVDVLAVMMYRLEGRRGRIPSMAS